MHDIHARHPSTALGDLVSGVRLFRCRLCLTGGEQIPAAPSRPIRTRPLPAAGCRRWYQNSHRSKRSGHPRQDLSGVVGRRRPALPISTERREVVQPDLERDRSTRTDPPFRSGLRPTAGQPVDQCRPADAGSAMSRVEGVLDADRLGLAFGRETGRGVVGPGQSGTFQRHGPRPANQTSSLPGESGPGRTTVSHAQHGDQPGGRDRPDSPTAKANRQRAEDVELRHLARRSPGRRALPCSEGDLGEQLRRRWAPTARGQTGPVQEVAREVLSRIDPEHPTLEKEIPEDGPAQRGRRRPRRGTVARPAGTGRATRP